MVFLWHGVLKHVEFLGSFALDFEQIRAAQIGKKIWEKTDYTSTLGRTRKAMEELAPDVDPAALRKAKESKGLITAATVCKSPSTIFQTNSHLGSLINRLRLLVIGDTRRRAWLTLLRRNVKCFYFRYATRQAWPDFLHA